MTNDELKALFGEQMRIIPTTDENAEKLLNGEEVNGVTLGENGIPLVPDDTDEKIKQAKDELKALILPLVYPVGSVYMSDTESNNPNNWENAPSWTWERIENKYLATQGTDFPITDGVHTGGNNSVTLSANNLPSHNHTISHTHGITVQTMANSGYTTSATVSFRETDGKENIVASTSGFASVASNTGGSYRTVGKSIVVDSDGSGFSLNVNHTHNASTSSQSTTTSGSTGGGQAFTVKPAYYVVYAWKRVS